MSRKYTGLFSFCQNTKVISAVTIEYPMVSISMANSLAPLLLGVFLSDVIISDIFAQLEPAHGLLVYLINDYANSL